MKKIATAVLLLLVAGSVVFVVKDATRNLPSPSAPVLNPGGDVSSSRAPSSVESSAPIVADATDSEKKDVFVAFYLHGTMRCPTCLNMERMAREAVEATFAEELAGGGVAWRAINTDEPENAHYAKDFELVSSGVVVAREREGTILQWRNLSKIWDLNGDEGQFKAYVVGEMTALRGDAR